MNEHRLGRRISRRRALRGAGTGVAGLAGAVLIGCGDSEDGEPTTSATAISTTEAGTPAATRAVETSTAAATGVSRGGTYAVPASGDPPTINPYANLSFAGKTLAGFVYNRLFKRETFAGSSPGESLPGPDAALSAESEDGITWTVTLRDNLLLHDVSPVDGRALDSEDVLASAARLQAEESPNREGVANWLKVEAPDAATVVFTLDAPSPTFLEQISDANLLHIFPREADGGFDPALEMIGGGPWVFEEYRPSELITLRRHDQYYEIGEDGVALPYLDRFEMPIIPEYANRLAQFRAGNIQELGINGNDVIDLKEEAEDVQWIGELPTTMSQFFFDHISTTDQPWRDARFRQAVSMALDRDALTDVGYNAYALRDAGLPASLAWNNLLPAGWGDRFWLDPQSPDHGDSGAFFRFDPGEARKLLDAQGVEEGFELSYIYSSRYTGAFPPIAEAQLNMLKQIGLAPETDVQDYSTQYITKTVFGDFEGVAFGYNAPYPEVGSYFDRSFRVAPDGTPANASGVDAPEMIDVFQRQRVELDAEARRAIIREGQILNAESMYLVPTQAGAGTIWTAYQPEVRGGIRSTLGYGAGAEEYAWYWLAS